MLRKILESNGDGFFQLRVVPFADRFRVLVDDNIGINAMVFHVPFALGRKEGDAG